MANTLAAELIIDISKFRKGLQDAQRAVNGAFKGSTVGKGMVGGMVAGVLGGTAAIVAAAVVTGGIFALAFAKEVARGIALAGENEKLQMRFEILTGSRGAGNRILAELREDALRTGITLEDMADNVSKFMAFGFDPAQAVKLNKGILDVGGSVGLTTRDMKLLGVALSQVAAKGVASMEELRQQIAEKGIPIFKALEQQLGVTGAELSTMIQEGKVSSDEVMKLFTGVPDGEGPFARFQGGAEKLAQTLPGIVTRMKAARMEFLRLVGDPLIDAIKPIMQSVLASMQAMVPQGAKLGQALADAVSYMTALGGVLASIPWSVFADIFKYSLIAASKEFVNFLWAALQGVAQGYVAYMIAGQKAMFDVLKIVMRPDFWNEMLFVFLNIAGEFIDKLFKGIVYISKYLQDNALNMALGRDVAPPNLPGGKKPESNLEELIATAIDGAANSLLAAADSFGKAFKESKNPFNSTEETEKVMGLIGGIRDAVNSEFGRLKAEQRAATAERNRLDGEASPIMGGAAESGAGSGNFGLNGVLSQAINTISGRSAFAVIAESASRSEQHQKQMADDIAKQKSVLDNIEKNTRPKTVGPLVPQPDASRFR